MVTIRCFVAIKRNEILIIQSLDKQTFPASFTTSVFQSGGNSKKTFPSPSLGVKRHNRPV